MMKKKDINSKPYYPVWSLEKFRKMYEDGGWTDGSFVNAFNDIVPPSIQTKLMTVRGWRVDGAVPHLNNRDGIVKTLGIPPHLIEEKLYDNWYDLNK